MYHSKFIALLALAVHASALPSPIIFTNTILARAPSAAHATVKSITYSGGCSSSTAEFVWKDSGTLVFDDMVVFTANNGPDQQPTKSCVVTVDIGLDAGWRYNVGKSTIFKGYYALDNGSELTLNTKYSIGAVSVTAAFPLSGDNLATHSTAYEGHLTSASGLWSARGGGVLTIDTGISLTDGNDASVLATLDSVDATFFFEEG